MQYTKVSFSYKIFTDVICCRQSERRSFIALKKKKKISLHIMKAIAEHGVVNQLMLKIGIIGPAYLLCLLGFMVEIPGSIDNQHTYFHVEVVKKSQF